MMDVDYDTPTQAFVASESVSSTPLFPNDQDALTVTGTDTVDTTASGEQSQAQPARRNAYPKKKLVDANRVMGRSYLPSTRVQKVLRADTALIPVQKEARHIIALATEEFTRRMGSAAVHIAQREGRATIQYRDVVSLVHRASEYIFLKEMLEFATYEPPQKGKKRGSGEEIGSEPSVAKKAKSQKKTGTVSAGPLDRFVAGKEGIAMSEDDTQESSAGQVVFNEDGTMSVLDS